MLKWTKGQKKMFMAFMITILLAVIRSSLPHHYTDFMHGYDTHTFLYAGLVIAWGFLVHERIVNPLVRRQLVIASVFMFFLFLCRLIRWRCFSHVPIYTEYAWYLYYVSFTMVPLCAFFAALCVGKTKEDRPLHRVKWLYLVQLLFAVLAFTNSYHELFFRNVNAETDEYEYGMAYYFCFVWTAVMTILSFLIILKRCRLKAAKKYWFIPVAGMLFGTSLSVLYYACGGSPEILGVKLYNLQEVFCLTFILPFECMIQIGILPNNSRYNLLFENSDFAAAILDGQGKVLYSSAKKSGGEESAPYVRRNEKKIHGGSVVWDEDLSAIHRIGEAIREATKRLEEENDLIRQENEIRAERISYETKNRLYDKIAGAVRDKAIMIDQMLTAETLLQATVLGAYVKRMGNLMLIAEETPQISTRELGNCIRESLEYYGLTGNMQSFLEKGETLLPAKLILLSYELFETVMETPGGLGSIVVWLDARDGYLLRISFDAKENPIGECWKQGELKAFGAVIRAERVDDVWRVQLTAHAKAAQEPLEKSAIAGAAQEKGGGMP